MWVSNSERPLHTSELCHALGVKIGSLDLSVESIPTIRTLLACSLGLITIEASSSTVRLVHFSLQEYLSDNLSLFQSPHSMIAEVCLTYLNFQCVRELSPGLSSAPPTVPLVEYASCYWGEHMRREKVESVSPLALGLLIQFEQHISSQLLLLRYDKDRNWGELSFNGESAPKGFTGLHGAAFFGIVEIVVALLAMKEWDINARDYIGRTALAWAAVRGHEDVVKTLLQCKDVKADTADGRTPLSLAAKNGDEGVVKLLLEREDINPNTEDTKYGQTPLWWAARKGYEGVVKLLLEREDINPNTADTRHGGTPLLYTAKNGHEGVVKLLLERKDFDPNTADTEYGQTPLLWATKNGHEGVLKLLLGREDINPNTAGPGDGGIPLLWAAVGGYEGVVRLLLERKDINPNTAWAEYGQAPLLWAARKGHEGVVKLLLEREDINPNTADTKYGQTPLLWAAGSGHEGVVKLLLEREDINPNTADTLHGGTPLSWAAWNGHEGAVKLLLGRDDVNLDIRDLKGRTALELAAYGGHTKVVVLLLASRPSLPLLVNIDKVAEHPPSPEPSDLLQNPTPPITTARPSPAKPLLPDTRPVPRMVIGSFMIISSLMILFYFLAVINPSFLTILSLSFRG